MEKYRVVCTKIVEENGVTTESIELDETYSGFTLLGTCLDDGRLNEVVMHDSLAKLAAKMASADHCKIAAKLACLMMEIEGGKASKLEDILVDAMMREGH